MQRRIKIVMVDMETYNEHRKDGFCNYPNVHHTLLSNCHLHKNWIELGIQCVIDDNKDTLMIGVDC